MGDYLFTDSVFLERLGEKPGLARRIYNKIKQMYRMATAGSKEARQLEQLKNKFEKMFQAKSDSKADSKTDTKAQKNTTKEGGARYSVSKVDSRLELSYDNSIMEAKDGSNGNEQREETREAFNRRAHEEKYTVRERGQIACGYIPSVVQTESAGRVKKDLEELGIQVIVHEGLEANVNGVTRVIKGDASTVTGDVVYVRNSMEGDTVETVGHEAYHFWKHTDTRAEYKETVADNIIFASEAFIQFQKKIEKTYFDEEIGIDDDGADKLVEEIYAYITGLVHAGDSNNVVRPFLRDYDAVKAAWDSLVDNHKKNNDLIKAGSNEPVFSLSQEGQQQRAYGDYRVSGEDVLLEGEQVQAEKTPLEVFMEEQIRRQEEEEKSRDAFWGAVMQSGTQETATEHDGKSTPAPEQIRTVKDRNQARLRAYETELANNERLQTEADDAHNEQIAKWEEEYNSKKNKNTTAAHEPMRRVERARSVGTP